MNKSFFSSLLVVPLAILLATGGASAQVNVTTHHNDNARTGQNLAETQLNTSNVNVARFGKLFSRAIDSIVWAQPLYVSGVAIPNKGTHNVVYVVDEVGGVYAYDADDPAQTAPLWRVGLIQSPYTLQYSVGTPVIDLPNKALFVVIKKVNSSGQTEFWFHSLDITTGADKPNSPVMVQGDVAGTGVGSINGRLAFRPASQKQRPGLLLSGNTVYMAFGGSVDEFAPGVIWNGWIFAYDATTLARKAIFCVAPNANGGGIWQAGNGLAADANGVIYSVAANGNGNPNSFTADTGGQDYGNSILKLTPGVNSLTLSDYFTPFNQRYLEVNDQDVGSSGPLLIPGTNLVVTGDKIGRMYVCDRRNLGHYQTGSNSQIVQDFNAWNGHLHGGPVYWNTSNLGPLIYGWPEHDYLKAFKVLGDTGVQTTPALRSTVSAPPGMPGGFLSISANGTTAGTGILWAALPYVGDANAAPPPGQTGVPGVLRAFDATTLKEIWNSELLSSRDKVGTFAKFAPPTVANGKVYVPTFSYKLDVYGLLPTATAPATAPTLSAAAGIYKTSLTWNAISGANGYYVKRAASASGPFVAVARNVLGTSYVDEVSAGTTYYYVVSAVNGGGEGPNSNIVSARPFAPAAGTVISVNFTGGSATNGTPTTMGATEVAGIVPVTNWNVAGLSDGTSTDVKTNGGSTTTADVTWSSLNTSANTIVDTAGNNRMMKGYLSGNTYPYDPADPTKPYPTNPEDPTKSYSQTLVTVSQIPANFASAGYDVYVYSDGENPTATRQATFTLAGQTQSVTDSKNRNFSGDFELPNQANVGNYVVFSNLTATSFTLEAIPGTTTDTTPRAPLNAFQIVAHQSAPIPPATPSNLSAFAGNSLVSLNWDAATGASSYVVSRATVSGGPYNAIASNITDLSYVDTSVTNGTTYYYVVAAVNSGGNSTNSNQASATPLASLAARAISLNFGGSATNVMAANETAGVVAAANWNNTQFPNGGKGDVVDNAGAKTTADVTWSADAAGDLGITDTAGNNRMMRSYITGSTNPTKVNVYNLPPSITARGYDVYVYADNNNGGARSTNYAIGATSVNLTDPAGTNYSGPFVFGNNTNGNFVKFYGLTASSFTITATAGTSTDAFKGSPINGVQIVALLNRAPVNGSLSPSSGSSTVGTGYFMAATYSDPDGFNDLEYCHILIRPSLNSGTFIYAMYNALTNRLYLRNDANTGWLGGASPGYGSSVSNSTGILDYAHTSVVRSGNTITVNWRFVPKTSFTGTKQVFLYCSDIKKAEATWKTVGSWTITAASPKKSSRRISQLPRNF